jgi:hypothetical protein
MAMSSLANHALKEFTARDQSRNDEDLVHKRLDVGRAFSRLSIAYLFLSLKPRCVVVNTSYNVVANSQRSDEARYYVSLMKEIKAQPYTLRPPNLW